jgi:hypothetical protein
MKIRTQISKSKQSLFKLSYETLTQVWHCHQRMKLLPRNETLTQEWHSCPRMKLLPKNETLTQEWHCHPRMKLLPKNETLDQEWNSYSGMKLLLRNETLTQEWNSCPRMTLLPKNETLTQATLFPHHLFTEKLNVTKLMAEPHFWAMFEGRLAPFHQHIWSPCHWKCAYCWNSNWMIPTHLAVGDCPLRLVNPASRVIGQLCQQVAFLHENIFKIKT